MIEVTSQFIRKIIYNQPDTQLKNQYILCIISNFEIQSNEFSTTFQLS